MGFNSVFKGLNINFLVANLILIHTERAHKSSEQVKVTLIRKLPLP